MEFLYWLEENIYVVFAAVFGMVFASFCCVVVERVPKGMSINGRSKCVCGRTLKDYENVPIFGWLFSRGTAKCCGAKIPSHYFWAEVSGAVGWALCVKLLDPTFGFITAAVLTAVITTVLTLKFKKANQVSLQS